MNPVFDENGLCWSMELAPMYHDYKHGLKVKLKNGDFIRCAFLNASTNHCHAYDYNGMDRAYIDLNDVVAWGYIEYIAGVAVLGENCKMVCLPAPYRHNHLFAMSALLNIDINPCTQGFVCNKGNFHNRTDALVIATRAKQIIKKHPQEDQLYSEDMW